MRKDNELQLDLGLLLHFQRISFRFREEAVKKKMASYWHGEQKFHFMSIYRSSNYSITIKVCFGVWGAEQNHPFTPQ